MFVPIMPSARGTSLINALKNLGLTTNLQLCLDAGDLNSYDGSSQTWKDLSGGGNDFYRGTTSSAESSDPTFNGTAGRMSSGEYFSFDGGDVLKIASSIPAWVQTLHKDNAAVSIAAWVYPAAISATSQRLMIFTTLDSGTTARGIYFGNAGSVGAGLNLGYKVENDPGTALSVVTAGAMTNSAWNFVGMCFDEASGALSFNINGTTETFSGKTYSSPSTSNTDSCYVGYDGIDFEHAGDRFSALAVWTSKLASTDLTAIFNASRGRYGV